MNKSATNFSVADFLSYSQFMPEKESEESLFHQGVLGTRYA
jgi:hypothetical protein